MFQSAAQLELVTPLTKDLATRELAVDAWGKLRALADVSGVNVPGLIGIAVERSITSGKTPQEELVSMAQTWTDALAISAQVNSYLYMHGGPAAAI